MLGDLYARTGSDFMGFYTFGRISQTDGYASIYKIEKQQRLQEEIVGHPVTPIFYTHLPFIAPLAKIIVNADYVESFKKWALVLLFLNLINVTVLVNLLDPSKFAKENLAVLFLGAFLFDPTFSGLMNGQDTAILLAGASLWIYGLFSKKYFLSGLCLSLTTVRPQIALFLAVPFLFHQRKVFLGFVLGSSMLALLSLALLQTEGTVRFIESIRYIESTVWRENHALDMPTISGIIRRNFLISDYKPIQRLVWLFYVFGIAVFSLQWMKTAEINEKHIGLIGIAAIFFVPYAHYHDLILLLIPIFCLIRYYQRTGIVRQNYLSLLPLATSWLLTIGFAGSGWFKFPFVYMVMIFLGYLLVRGDKTPKIFPSPAA
jgi:hypothetical protein